jgi:ATP-dependent RNA helicase DeaD
MITFKDLSLAPAIQQALDTLGFTTPTEIQQKAIPILLGKDKIDVLGQAQTGTGKTLAFGIPLLHKIDPKKRHVQALIVAPTRELVLQIRDSLRQVAKHMEINIEAIYGGVSMVEQIQALKRGVHIVVGTPGRLNDHLRRGTLSLKALETLVLDEADTMLDMGFKEEVDEIMTNMPDDRQIWLFSATVKPGINDLMKSHMRDTVSILVNRKEVTAATTRFIDNAPEFYGFIFCQTKMLTAEVAEKLQKRGYGVNALHGDMSQVQRNHVIKKFKKKEFTILIATDVAARGIDVSDITHVINFSLPDDQESYVHRIGRTGRAGKEGIAITFVTQSDLRRLRSTAMKFKFEIQPLEVPRLDAIANIQQNKALTALSESTQKLAVSNKFIDALYTKVCELSKDELAHAVANSLYEKYLGAVIPEKDIDLPVYRDNGNSYENNAGSDEALNELFLSIGGDDGIEKIDVIDYLVSSAKVTKQDVKRVKILNKHTFAVVPEAHAQEVIQALFGQQLNGKRVRISVTNEVPDLSGSRGDRGGSRFGGGRSRGGDRGPRAGGNRRREGGRSNFERSRGGRSDYRRSQASY